VGLAVDWPRMEMKGEDRGRQRSSSRWSWASSVVRYEGMAPAE